MEIMEIQKGQTATYDNGSGDPYTVTIARVQNRTIPGRFTVEDIVGYRFTATGDELFTADGDPLVDDPDRATADTVYVTVPGRFDGVALPDNVIVPDGSTAEVVNVTATGLVWADVTHADGSRTTYRTLRGQYVTEDIPAPDGVAPNGVVRAEAFGTRGVQGHRTIDRVWNDDGTEDKTGVATCAVCGDTTPVTKFPTDGPNVRINIHRYCNTVELVARGSSRDIAHMAH